MSKITKFESRGVYTP